MRRVLLLLGVVVLVAAGVGYGASGSVPRGAMVFSSTRSPMLHSEIWVVDARTGARRSFSRSPTRDDEPTVSPDRQLVAFVSDRDGADAVWTRRADGTGLRRIAGPFRDAYVRGLRWNPSGRRLAFVVAGKTGQVWIVSRTGGHATRWGERASEVEWSPDGRRLAMTESNESGAPSVAVYGVDG